MDHLVQLGVNLFHMTRAWLPPQEGGNAIRSVIKTSCSLKLRVWHVMHLCVINNSEFQYY